MEDRTVMAISLFAMLLIGVVGIAGMMKVTTTASTIQTTSSVRQTPTCHCVIIQRDSTGRVLQVFEQEFRAGSSSADDTWCQNAGERKYSGSRKDVDCYRVQLTLFPT